MADLSIGQILRFRYPAEILSMKIIIEDTGQGASIKKWDVEGVPKPTKDQILEMVNDKTYLTNLAVYNRLNAQDGYPPIADQLDLIYTDGLAGWKTIIAAVKQRYPKPV